MAAEQDNTAAQYNLAVLLITEKGVFHAEVLEWVQRAADQRHDEALPLVALVYSLGLGVAQDHTKMVEWLQKEPEQIPSGLRLAEVLYTGMA